MKILGYQHNAKFNQAMERWRSRLLADTAGRLAYPPGSKDGFEFIVHRAPQFAALRTRGNARKLSGSYYTPDSLVQALLDSALEPVIAQRFAGTLAMLLKSGVPLIDAVQLSGASTGFKTVEHAAERAVEELRHGVPITRALQPISAVQTHLATWIRAGDAGGDLAGMLGEALVRCREVVRRRLDQALQWVEPVMVILVGLLILGVALAILLPILSLNQSIGA